MKQFVCDNGHRFEATFPWMDNKHYCTTCRTDWVAKAKAYFQKTTGNTFPDDQAEHVAVACWENAVLTELQSGYTTYNSPEEAVDEELSCWTE